MKLYNDHPSFLQQGREDGVGGRQSLVTETGVQTLTNKTLTGAGGTLTAPTITDPVVTGGNIQPAIFILPIADPEVAGALWNNAGTITISAG